jgi:hypothetical protein
MIGNEPQMEMQDSAGLPWLVALEPLLWGRRAKPVANSAGIVCIVGLYCKSRGFVSVLLIFLRG